MLEEVDEDSADEIDSIRIVYEVDEGYALSFYHLILKKYDDEIQLIGRYGCEEDDEDLNRIEMYEEYFGEDRDLQLYALLVNEFNKSYESFGKSNSDIFAVAGDTRRTACITPTMMAIFKEFMIWDNDVLYDTYSVIYNCFIKQMEEK